MCSHSTEWIFDRLKNLTAYFVHTEPFRFNMFKNAVKPLHKDHLGHRRKWPFALSIVHNLCFLQQYKWNKIKIRLPQLITNAPHRTNSMTILDFFISGWKNWPLSRGYPGRLFSQLGTRFSGRCRCGEVAVVERS